MSDGNGSYLGCAVGKLLLFIFACVSTSVVILSLARKALFVVNVISIILSSLMFTINIIWTTVDWIRILAGAVPDGNGVALEVW